MVTLEEIEQQIAEIEAEIQPLNKRLWELAERRKTLKSQQWIAANGVTLKQIHLLKDCEDYMLNFQQLGQWLSKQKSLRRFVEWNTEIHFSADVVSGRYLESGAHVSDIPKKTALKD